MPGAWHSNWIAVAGTDLELEGLADRAAAALDLRGRDRRTIVVLDEAEGARLGAEAKATGGWEAEASEVATIRRRMIAPGLPAAAEVASTTADLLELDRRLGVAAGVRWFVAPSEGEPLSVCSRFDHGDGIGQIEDVGTLAEARGRGLARAVVEAAMAAARGRGDATIFLTADAAGWPQRFYERLGFEPVGDVRYLRLP